VEKARRILVELWGKEDIQNKYVEALLSSDPSLNICILGSHLLSCLANIKDDSNLAKVKQFLVDVLKNVLKKTILPSKSKISASSVAEKSPFLRLLTHSEMASQLVPVMTDVMRRSPEVALSTGGSVRGSVSIDISGYVSGLCKTISTNLSSKDDNIRKNAIIATLALAKKFALWGGV